jgi:hypothetical protein
VEKGDPKSGKPRRTRQHIIASLSRNHVERFIFARGHTAEGRIHDYGYDLFVETYDEDGYIENDVIRIQLKATDRLEKMRRGDSIGIDIDVRHYELWKDELMPVFLVLYDAQERKAYWVHVQDYFATPSFKPKRGAKTFRLYLPVANEFTEQTVDEMRARKAEILAEGRRRRRDHG